MANHAAYKKATAAHITRLKATLDQERVRADKAERTLRQVTAERDRLQRQYDAAQAELASWRDAGKHTAQKLLEINGAILRAGGAR